MAEWPQCVQCEQWNQSIFVGFISQKVGVERGRIGGLWIRFVKRKGKWGEAAILPCTFSGVNDNSFYARWTCTDKTSPCFLSRWLSLVGRGATVTTQRCNLHWDVEGQWFKQNHSPSYLDEDWKLVGRIEHLQMPMESATDFIDVCKVAFTRSTIGLSYSLVGWGNQ